MGIMILAPFLVLAALLIFLVSILCGMDWCVFT